MAVSVIEMAGMVGAGKSTLADAMRVDLESRGFRVYSVEDALRVVLGRSKFGFLVRRLLGSPDLQRRVFTRTYRLLVRPWHTLRFVTRNPGLAWMAMCAAWQSPLPIGHRRRILGLFFRPGVAQAYFEPRMCHHEILVLEEGLIHRAVNLFAWSDEGDRSAVVRYLRLTPETELVVLVTASLDSCFERVGVRGLPQRLMGRDEETVTRFMERTSDIVAEIEDFLLTADRPSIVIDNGGQLAEAVATLNQAIARRLPARSVAHGGPRSQDHRPPAPRQLFATTPRYAGGVRLPRYRRRGKSPQQRQPRISADLVSNVLTGFDLDQAGAARATPAGGRADNVIVATSAGEKLVKRYKDSVTESAIAHEHSILMHLASLAFPSPRLCVAPDGTTVRGLDGRWYAVFDYRRGFFHYNDHLWLPPDQGQLAGLSGEALGSLHVALYGFVPQGTNASGFATHNGERWRGLEWYLAGLERARRAAGDGTAAASLHTMLAEHSGQLESELRSIDAELAAADLPRQVIHGDYGPYNLLLKKGERVMILDFELARIDWRVADVAKSLQQFGVNRLGLRLGRVARFVAGYQERCPLGADERRLLPSVWLFLTLRRVIVCWDRFADSGNDMWLDEAKRKLALADVIRGSADKLASLEGTATTRGRA